MARHLAPGQRIAADVCVVGSGPAGLTVAAALVRAGHSVCVVESGYAAPHQGAQELSALESVGHPVREPFVHRLRMLGGTANLWAGRCMPLEPIDFETRDWVPASGWPVSFADYLGFLRQAGRLMGLPQPFIEPIANRAGQQAPGGPPALFGRTDFSSKLVLWAKRPPNFWSLFGTTLKRSSACRIVIGLTVTGLRLNDAGTRVTALRAVPSTGGPAHELCAGRFILAMGGDRKYPPVAPRVAGQPASLLPARAARPILHGSSARALWADSVDCGRRPDPVSRLSDARRHDTARPWPGVRQATCPALPERVSAL